MPPGIKTRSFGARVAIQVFAWSVGLAIVAGLDRLTGWVGIFR